MKEWLLSIIAVIIITSVLSLIIPDGKMGKYIKSVISLLIILIIIQPVFNIKKIDFDFKSIFYNSEDIDIQTNYLEYVSTKKTTQINNECIKILESNNIKNAEVDISYAIEENETIKINYIIINLQDAVILSDKAHIDIIDSVRNAIANHLSINKKLVIINE